MLENKDSCPLNIIRPSFTLIGISWYQPSMML